MMRQSLAKLLITVFAGVSVWGAPTLSSARDADDAGQFINFFQSVIKTQHINAEDRVWRWPPTIETCVYGEYNSSDKARLIGSIELIEDLTSLKFATKEVQGVDKCPADSLLYIRFNSENEAARKLIFEDIKYINELTGRSYIQSFSSISSLATGNYGIGGDLKSYMYMSTKNSIGGNDITDNDAQNELMQKPLFQILTGIEKAEGQRFINSFLSDDLKSFVFPLSHGKLNFLDKSRKTNLCFYDAMLLRVLYNDSSALNNPNAEVGKFINYISEEYKVLSSDVSTIISKKRYKRIMSRKC